MAIKRLTKADIDKSFATFNPVGHIVLAFDDDATAQQASDALKAKGLADADVLAYSSSELQPRMHEKVHHASEGAGFGYEITLMRRYLALANEGVGWLIVYVPDDEAAAKVTDVAKQLGARSAVRYHRLANEDLL